MNCSLCKTVSPCKRLKIIRTLLDFKQETFAIFLGISINTLQKWENRGIWLTTKHRDKFRYVGINAQWIDYGTGEPLSIEKSKVIANIWTRVKAEIKG